VNCPRCQQYLPPTTAVCSQCDWVNPNCENVPRPPTMDGAGDETQLPSPISSASNPPLASGQPAPDDVTRRPSQTTEATNLPPGFALPSPAIPNNPVAPSSGSVVPGRAIGPEGRYRVTRMIGRGGFAETFLAVDTQLFDGPCVVKRLRIDPDQPEAVRTEQEASLEREAALLVALKTPGHPNIPEVYAYLSADHCLVMKYVEGISLQALLDQRSEGLPEAEALRYAYEISSALAYMHARETLHLDVKPANVLLDSNDRVWLIDFGIGRSLVSTDKAMPVGTPGFTPPEQWRCNPEPRSDVFALGMTLFALLTNRRPSPLPPQPDQAETWSLLRQYVPTVRPEVELMIQRATDPEPGRRPSAADILDELRLLRTRIGVPRPARPPQTDTLVGRETELDRIWAELESDGGGVIVGMPGVGKTALATGMARRFARSEHVFWHTFRSDEGFETLLWNLGAFLAWDGHADLWDLLQRSGQGGAPPQVLLDYLLDQLQGQPYLLCLDDLQQVAGDQMIVRWIERLETLARTGGPKLLITTRKALDLNWPAARISLSGLATAAAVELVTGTGLTLEVSLLQQLIYATSGIPQLLLLAGNALRHSQRPATLIERLTETDSIERYLLREVDEGLSADERELMEAIAVLGGMPGPRELLEEMLGRRLRRPLRDLLDRQLLVASDSASGTAYTQHAIVQSFYYGDLPQADRYVLHQRAAVYYEAKAGDDLWAARHYAGAGAVEQAAALATRDLWGAVNRGQAGVLLALLRQLPLDDLGTELRLAVLMAIGTLATLLSETAAARSAYEAAFGLLAVLPDSNERRVQQARICRGMGGLLQSQDPAQAHSWVERGLALLGDADPYEAALLQQRGGAILIGLGENEAAGDMLDQALAVLPAQAEAERADTLTNRATIAWLQGDPYQGEALARQALELYEHTGQRWKQITIRQNLGIGKHFSGDWTGAVAEYAGALQAAEDMGGIVRQAELQLCLGSLATNQGDFDAARQHLEAGITLARRHQLHEQLSLSLSSLADLLLREGASEMAGAALVEAEELARRLNLRYQFSELARTQAELLLAGSAPERALALANSAAEYARGQGNPRDEGMSQRVAGLALLAAEQTEPARERFEQSVALLDGQDPYEAARVRVAWSTMRNDATGEALLRVAETTFAALGARYDLEETRNLLTQRRGKR
jgi:tRNA A-37 threonylcarbamoyl transferase component Bud32